MNPTLQDLHRQLEGAWQIARQAGVSPRILLPALIVSLEIALQTTRALLERVDVADPVSLDDRTK